MFLHTNFVFRFVNVIIYCKLFVHFPFEYSARLTLTQFGENLQARGLHRGEVDTVVAVLGHSVRSVVCYLLPLILGILIIERPRFGGAEITIVVVEVEPIHLYITYLVFLVELIGNSLGSALLEPPIVVRLRGVTASAGFPLVVGAASPRIYRSGLRGIILDSPRLQKV